MNALRAVGSRGFALLLTLALLALIVLAIYGLSVLVRVSSSSSATTLHRMRAKQNALVALKVALGELQFAAGVDDRATGMAGIAGVGAHATNSTRHWCGVWTHNGAFLGWLTSGSQSISPALRPGLRSVALVANGSVGAAQANSEHVVAGILPIPDGGIAYWVGDEGLKISAFTPDETAVPGLIPTITDVHTASNTLRAMVEASTNQSRLSRALSFEQLRIVPSTALTAGVLHDNFHHVTLTGRVVLPQPIGVALRTGTFNVNTTSAIAWRGIFRTYNASGATPQISSSALGTIASTVATSTTTVQGRLARDFAATIGQTKAVNSPFLDIDDFGSSSLLNTALSGSGVTPGQFMAVMRNILTVRSDTFRIRAYGESTNTTIPEAVESIAICEAIVQRTLDSGPNGVGRRFVITYFRWLTPADI